MNLFEFEAKDIIRKYGIPVPPGGVCSTAREAGAVAREMGKPVALKAQVLTGGRGKAGGILFADVTQASEVAAKLLGSSVNGNTVKKLLVEEKLEIAEQYYASVAVDRQARAYVVLASAQGGVDIEQVAQASPRSIGRHWVDPATGFEEAAAGRMLATLGFKEDVIARMVAIMGTLYGVAMDCDAVLVEINPLVRTLSGEFVAADARMVIDDNALFRHPEFAERSLGRVEDTPLEAKAREQGLAYVDLEGDIGIIGNGAGLVMATLDMVHYFGGSPANFLDAGGGGDVDITKQGLLLVMSKPGIKAVLVNIMGGITRCDVVARAIIEALNESPVKKPISVRMMGTNEVEGTRMLSEVGVYTYPNMEEAVSATLRNTGIK